MMNLKPSLTIIKNEKYILFDALIPLLVAMNGRLQLNCKKQYEIYISDTYFEEI
ncbi:unnamed protein product [Arabidopsis halleri]